MLGVEPFGRLAPSAKQGKELIDTTERQSTYWQLHLTYKKSSKNQILEQQVD